MARVFTLEEARALMPALVEHVAGTVALRADLADARVALQQERPPPAGTLPELKALEARLQEAVDWFGERGIALKGFAPVIADFPAVLEGEAVLLCYLEGESELDWYHPAATGFMGRRRIGRTWTSS